MHRPEPNLFVAGAPKAGTTSLSSWLGAHSEVYWCTPKEPFYFASDFPGQREHYGFTTRQDYIALYQDGEASRARYRGDGSTTYLYSDVAVPAILDMDPDARFVVSVRDPVELLPSYHRTQVVALNEDRHSFADAWRATLEGQGPGVRPLDPVLVDYPRMGRQGAALQVMLDRVPREQVHLVVFDDLRQDPQQVWRTLAQALGLDPAGVTDLSVRNTSTKQARFPTIRRLTHRPPAVAAPAVRRVRQWSRTTRVPGVAQLKSALWSPARPPRIGDDLRTELADYFSDDVALLQELLRRDLSHWTSARGAR